MESELKRFSPIARTLAAACALCLAATAALADTQPLVSLVSLTWTGSPANDDSAVAVLSSDARYVAFQSEGQNLVPGDAGGKVQIYLRDRTLNQTALVSANNTGAFAGADCREPAISSDGRYVAFHSAAANLAAADTNAMDDVFVRDSVMGATVRVSVGPGGAQGSDDSQLPAFSATGRYVAFQSKAANLLAAGEDTNGKWDVFVFDRDADGNGVFDETTVGSVKTVRVSVNSSGAQASGDSFRPSISASGRYVAFDSVAADLAAGDGNGRSDVFVHDRDADGDGLFDEPGATATGCVSRGRSGFANGDSLNASLAGDGGTVGFESLATDLLAVDDTNGKWDVYARQLSIGLTVAVSVSPLGQPGNGDSVDARLSADGRYVGFSSAASDLVSGDTNGKTDVFLRDRWNSRTARASITSAGSQVAGEDTADPAISADGRFVAFSTAAALTPADANGKRDVFLFDSGTGVSAVKMAPAQAAAGEMLTYTVVVSNVGLLPQAALVVTDAVPVHALFVADSMGSDPAGAAAETPPSGVSAGSVLTWTIETLAGVQDGGNAVTLTFAARSVVPITDGTSISNTVRVAGLTPAAATRILAAPQLAIGKSVSPPMVSRGGTLSYTIWITNTGTGIGTGLVVTDAVPAGTSYVAGSMSASPTGAGTWTAPALPGPGNVMTWSIPSVASGVALSFQSLVDQPVAERAITNTVWLSGASASAVAVAGSAAYLPSVLRAAVDYCDRPDLDPYEPNDTWQQATPITQNVTLRANFKRCAPLEPNEDKDEYAFTSSGQPIALDLTGVPDGSDYDLYLFRQLPSLQWQLVRKSDLSGRANERIVYGPTAAGDKYLVQVFGRLVGPLSMINWYTLQIAFN